MEKKPFKSPYVTITLEENILTGYYASGLTVDIEMAKQIVHHRLSNFHGDYLSLVDIRSVKLVTKEARDYFAKEGTKGLKALAIIVGGHITVIMGNLFIRFSKPKIPTKLFKTKEHALNWLNQFRELGEL